jgi:hypothetical protein
MKMITQTEHVEKETRLPFFRCHKIVQAAKILGLTESHAQTEFGPVMVPDDFCARSKPEIGRSYVVVYEDGYISHSPADAFEAGYSPMDDR